MSDLSPLTAPFHICPKCGVKFEEPKRHEADGFVDLSCPACEYHFAHWPAEDKP